MPRPTKKATGTNPFYVLLLLASTLFVVTALAYTVSPSVFRQAAERPAETGPGPTSRALADWVDRHGPTALGVEFAVMLAAGILAMVTDGHFAPPTGAAKRRV